MNAAGARTKRQSDALFEEIATLIVRAGSPFPTSHVRRLVLRATAQYDATDEMAELIDRLNSSLGNLSAVIEEIGGGFNYNREDAFGNLGALETACNRQRRSMPH